MFVIGVDFRTLVLSLAALYVVQAVILLFLLLSQRDYAPAYHWANGAALTATGAILFILRDHVAEWFSVIAGNGLLLFGTALPTCGLMIACERQPPWRTAGVWCGACLAVTLWFFLVEPSFSARVATYHAGIGLFLVVEVAVLLDGRRGPVGAARYLIAAGSLLCLIFGTIRGVSSLREFNENSLPNVAFLWSALVRCFTQTAGCAMLVGERYRRELERISRQDALTGLLNRRAFDEIANRLWAQARRKKWTVSAMMLDIDHFKSINDRFGHAAGDAVLRDIGEMLRLRLRIDDLVGRHGGEEFAVLLPDTGLDAAAVLAERIRQSCTSLVLPDGGHPSLSIGIAAEAEGLGEWPQLLDLADQALYQAKAQGRNCVVAYQDGPRAGEPD